MAGAAPVVGAAVVGALLGVLIFCFFAYFLFFLVFRDPVFYWSWQIKNTRMSAAKICFLFGQIFSSQKIQPKISGPQSQTQILNYR